MRLTVGGLFTLGLGALWLAAVWGTPASLQWLAQSTVLWLFIYFQTARRLTLNRAEPQSPLYAQLGWGNRLTLLRSWLIAATGGFLFQAWPEGAWLAWLPGMIYFFGAVLDRVDGFVARRTGQMSQLGNELDTVSDALGMAVAAGLAWSYGQVHWSYLLMGAAYYLFHAGLVSQTHARSAHLSFASCHASPGMGRISNGLSGGGTVALVLPAGYPNSRICFYAADTDRLCH